MIDKTVKKDTETPIALKGSTAIISAFNRWVLNATHKIYLQHYLLDMMANSESLRI